MNVSPRDMVCLGNMCVDTLHKGDDDYNNKITQDIIILDVRTIRILIDVAILSDRNVIKK
jgi:hypothetical protein